MKAEVCRCVIRRLKRAAADAPSPANGHPASAADLARGTADDRGFSLQSHAGTFHLGWALCCASLRIMSAAFSPIMIAELRLLIHRPTGCTNETSLAPKRRSAKLGKSRGYDGSGSRGPLHRDTHYFGSPVFLPESSLTWKHRVSIVRQKTPFMRDPSPSKMFGEQVQIQDPN